jgi:porphobilinogen synthase
LLSRLGISAALIFALSDKKDACGSEVWNNEGICQRAIKTIKKENPDLCVVADCCLSEYTDHGHCGVILEKGGVNVDNDQTLIYLFKYRSPEVSKLGTG